MANTWRSITSMAMRSSSPHHRLTLAAMALAVLICLPSAPALSCPFCTALEPTLGQRRAQASVVSLAEMQSQQPQGRATVGVHQVLAGEPQMRAGETVELALDIMARPGSLLLLFGTPRNGARGAENEWHGVVVDETSYAYFAKAPRSGAPAGERLRYFAKYLEHPNPLIAQDAYLEFGHASLADVTGVIDALPSERLRAWIIAESVLPARKGFYGLALGLAPDGSARRKNAEFLQGLIVEPQDDFRAGFDGILGGYLLLKGEAGLELIERRYLNDPSAADGDVRHALVALRFYHEHGHEIPLARLQVALRRVLARPEFAAAAITDLARWQDWQKPESIAALYADKAYSAPATRLAIVGYLLACPAPEANQALRQLRQEDPQGVAVAEEVLSRTGSFAPAKE